jgi:CheY-like chemotaxis protein
MRSRVLVVDDSPASRREVALALYGHGYDVVERASLEEAAAVATDAALILLGGVPPVPQIWLERLSASSSHRHERTAVVLMAARAVELDGRHRRAGVVDVLMKPFTLEALVAVVSRALGAHAAPIDDFGEHEHTLPGLTRGSATSVHLHTDVDGSETGEAKRPQVLGGYALTGELSHIALPELLQLIKLQSQTGLLAIDTDHLSVDVAFEGGHVVGVISAASAARVGQRGAQRLGRYLIATGGISPSKLEASLAAIPRRGLLGLRLLEAGVIDAPALHRAVTEQAHDTMVELLRSRRGVFGLRAGPEHLPHAIVRPGWSVDGLLFEALRRVDEWGVMESEVGSLDARFTVRGSLNLDRLSIDEAAIVRLVAEAPVRVVDIIERSSLLPFDVCRVLYRLAALGRIERCDDDAVAGPRGERPKSSEPLLSLPPLRSGG